MIPPFSFTVVRMGKALWHLRTATAVASAIQWPNGRVTVKAY